MKGNYNILSFQVLKWYLVLRHASFYAKDPWVSKCNYSDRGSIYIKRNNLENDFRTPVKTLEGSRVERTKQHSHSNRSSYLSIHFGERVSFLSVQLVSFASSPEYFTRIFRITEKKNENEILYFAFESRSNNFKKCENFRKEHRLKEPMLVYFLSPAKLRWWSHCACLAWVSLQLHWLCF